MATPRQTLPMALNSPGNRAGRRQTLPMALNSPGNRAGRRQKSTEKAPAGQSMRSVSRGQTVTIATRHSHDTDGSPVAMSTPRRAGVPFDHVAVDHVLDEDELDVGANVA